MKTLGILGTSSDSGKSWLTTALCALLHKHGVNVAPFKAQNMSNNAYATAEGHEIGVAQAVQAEACGRRPISAMNPVLLKPMQDARSQVILNGKPIDTLDARDYYTRTEILWGHIADTLEEWKQNCDVLLMEGAGSPVELNFMERDLANLRPVRHTDGKWLLVADIERGGVFAQIAGTWQLMPTEDKARGLGVVVNRFRGDMSLFDGAETHLKPYCPIPLLGTLPLSESLRPDEEDGMRLSRSAPDKAGVKMAWLRLPRIANATDAQPWLLDEGVHLCWAGTPAELEEADIIVIPGTKHTRADLRWLRERGLDKAILAHAHAGKAVIGICGGYQMLGRTIEDLHGSEGDRGSSEGLGLLPIDTVFSPEKTVRRVQAHWEGAQWEAYEIHLGQSTCTETLKPFIQIAQGEGLREEGCIKDNIMGTYVHGAFDHPSRRTALMQMLKIPDYRAHPTAWKEHKQDIYRGMAECLETHLNLDSLWRYLDA